MAESTPPDSGEASNKLRNGEVCLSKLKRNSLRLFDVVGDVGLDDFGVLLGLVTMTAVLSIGTSPPSRPLSSAGLVFLSRRSSCPSSCVLDLDEVELPPSLQKGLSAEVVLSDELGKVGGSSAVTGLMI